MKKTILFFFGLVSIAIASAQSYYYTSGKQATLPISGSEGSVELDLHSASKGDYIVQLVVSNEVLDAKQFVVE